MVNFQYASDLHIETLSYTPEAEEFFEPVSKVLILAGDIGRVHRFDQLADFLQRVCSLYKIVLYTPGNHEYYYVDGTKLMSMDEILQRLHNLSNFIPNLHILHRSSVIINDVCVVGATLWSKATINIPQKIVRIPGITTHSYNNMHSIDLKYIEDMIAYCQKHSLKCVVVTHHAPAYFLTQQKRKKTYDSLYYTDLEHLLKKDKVHSWLYGHVHRNMRIISAGGTQLLSNQKGKEKDKITDFSKRAVIEIK
jgi:predicted phosphohydrolase